MPTLGKRIVVAPPPDRPHSPKRPARFPAPSRPRRLSPPAVDTQTAAVLAVLVSAAVASLLTALYILALPSSHPTPSRLRTLGAHAVHPVSRPSQASATQPPPSIFHQHDNYLAYLPHSGFHNQRIALENALVLARILNRTLLLPPVRLGLPLAYVPFDDLSCILSLPPNSSFDYCGLSYLDNLLLPSSADEYTTYTHLSWSALLDLSAIHADQSLLEGWDFTDAWLHRVLDISPDTDVYYLKDTTRNQYTFQDFFSLDPPTRNFTQSLYIPALTRRPERLIWLGTLFGSARLHLRSDDNLLIRRRIREQMVFTHPDLVRAASHIKAALGHSYLAAHLRIGDGNFDRNARHNVRVVWWKLLHVVLGFSDTHLLQLERELSLDEEDDGASEPPFIAPDIPALRTPHPPLAPFPSNASPSSRLACRRSLHTDPALLPLNAPVFIATDGPAEHPLLSRFLRTFPCAFFLDDFPGETRRLGELRNEVDGVPLAPFLMPFLDAMVAGRAEQVVGTEQSTFSAFVTDVLWRRYHGYEIVQRG